MTSEAWYSYTMREVQSVLISSISTATAFEVIESKSVKSDGAYLENFSHNVVAFQVLEK